MADTDRSIPLDPPVKHPLLRKGGVLKVLVPAGLVALAVLVALLLFKKFQPTPKVSEDRPEVSVKTAISAEDLISKAQAEEQLKDGSIKASDFYNELSERVDDLDIKLKTMLAEIEALKTGQQASGVEVKGLHSRLSSIEQSNQGDGLVQNELSVRLGAVEEKLSDLSHTREKARRSPSSVKEAVDFKLLSIDQWGGVPSAVIDHGGVVKTVSEGDVIAQWRVRSIGHEGCLEVQSLTNPSSETVCQATLAGVKQ